MCPIAFQKYRGPQKGWGYMKRDDALKILAQHRDKLHQQFGVASLALFGSVARGEATRESDLDLLYELVPGIELGWEIDDLQTELADLFGRPVDLVSKRALHHALRPAVLADARLLYAA